MHRIVLSVQILKIVKYIIVMICLSFFTGLFWLALCQIKQSTLPEGANSTFLKVYELESMSID